MDKIVARIWYGDECMNLHASGGISRECLGNVPSGGWLCTGAVMLNSFGKVVRRFTLAEVIADPAGIPWKFKNGKQRTHITDLDHGTRRMWGSPKHSVTRVS